MTILTEAIDDVDVEIKFVNSSRKKQKTVIDHYEFIKQLNDFYFYKIWIADDLKLQEDEKIILKSSGVSIDAVIISVHETQDFTIRSATKLTEEIYYLTQLFDPTFILGALKHSLSLIDIFVSKLLRKIIEKVINNEAIEINDESSFLGNLNQAQKAAILLTESKEVSLIWGPPGTGKTHTLSQIIYRAFLREEKVLVLSTSNVAIDQVILYLDKFLYSDEKKSVLRLGYTDNDISIQYTRDNLSSIDESIVFSTLATSALKNEKLLEVSFDLVIVDEASMVSLPYAFLAASMSLRNIVYAGDFRQLPPIALAENTSLSENIFDYLRVSEKIDKHISLSYLALLDTQYRMCRDISDVVSSLFYKNLLKCGIDQPQQGQLEFIDIGKASGYYDSYYSVEYESYYNPITIAILSQKFTGLNNSTFLFISPYRAQQNIVSYYLIDGNYKNSRSLTVHKSQGSEADIVVFDLTTHTRTNKSGYHSMFMTEHTENLINVAMSRTKKHLIIIGSLEMISNLSKLILFWSNFYKKINEKFVITKSSSLFQDNNKFNISFSDEKVVICIDKRNTKDFLDAFKKTRAEKKIYFSSLEIPIQSSITFRRLPDTAIPEMIIWGKRIVLRENNTYYSFYLSMTSEVLRRISVGHLVDMAEPSRENTYILNCENCGANKVVDFDSTKYYYVLKCTKCHHTTFITEKVANNLKVVYNIKCPEPNCGADMKPRRKNGQRSFSFFGCTNYPKCKGLVSFRDIAV